MKRLWKPLVLLLVIGVVAADLYFDSQNSINENGLVNQTAPTIDLPVGTAVGELAPDFAGTTLEGEVVQLSSLRGKVVLVNDFASWCGPCLAETPHLVETFNSYSDQVVIIGLNLQENEQAVAAYRDDFAITYPLVMDPDGHLTEIFRPIGLPTSWFIDPDGVVRYVHAGPMTATMILRAIDEVAAGREPDLSILSG